MVELSQGCLRCGASCLRCGASCPLIWGKLSSEGGASCLGARFLWGELSWGELSLGRVVCHSWLLPVENLGIILQIITMSHPLTLLVLHHLVTMTLSQMTNPKTLWEKEKVRVNVQFLLFLHFF